MSDEPDYRLLWLGNEQARLGQEQARLQFEVDRLRYELGCAQSTIYVLGTLVGRLMRALGTSEALPAGLEQAIWTDLNGVISGMPLPWRPPAEQAGLGLQVAAGARPDPERPSGSVH